MSNPEKTEAHSHDLARGTPTSKQHILQSPRSADHNPVQLSGNRTGVSCTCCIQTMTQEIIMTSSSGSTSKKLDRLLLIEHTPSLRSVCHHLGQNYQHVTVTNIFSCIHSDRSLSK